MQFIAEESEKSNCGKIVTRHINDHKWRRMCQLNCKCFEYFSQSIKIQVDDESRSRRWKIKWLQQIRLKSKCSICTLINVNERSQRVNRCINHVQIQSIFEKSQPNDFFLFLFLQLAASVYLIVFGHVYTFLSRSSGMDNAWDNMIFHTHCHCY